MNADLLLTHYERIADAPDTVARFRRFILDLAVRGKLVPQDPKEEPASELLKRIAAEKARQVKAGKIKASKPLLPVDDDADFDVPPNWQWARLGVITSYIQRGKSPKYTVSDGALVVSQRCVQWSGLDLTVAKQVTLGSLADYEPIRFLRDGDLLWNSTGTGTIGRVIRLVQPPKKLVCDSHVTVVRCLEVDPEYVRIWLRSDHVYGYVEERAAGSTNQVELTAQMAINQIVPLPPFAEQKRIVAKVDELMALCDQLDKARAEREATRDRLAAASLARLNVPDPETFQDDARFALAALPAMTTRPDQVKHLRQTLLNLAVRGKLVPQDSKEEAVSKLLERIQKEKTRLASDGRIRLPKPLPQLTDADVPFTITPAWRWVRLSDVSDVQDPNPSHRMPHYVANGGAPFISSENFSEDDGIDFTVGKRIAFETLNEQIARFPILPGAIGLTRIGTIGKSRFLPANRTYGISHAVCVINPLDPISLSMRFLRMVLSVDTILAFAHRGTRSIGVPDLGMAVIRSMALPLPPLAEQHRIVAKVDELMSLCDRLEAGLSKSGEVRDRLLDALLHEALEPASGELEAAA